MLELEKARMDLKKEIEDLTNSYNQNLKAKKAQLDEVIRQLAFATNDLNLQYIKDAEAILDIYGKFEKAGQDKDVVMEEFISKFVTDWTFFKRRYLGTKSYASWHGQSIECEYGMGPSHGSVIFHIGYKRDFRNSEEMSDYQKNVCLYYLRNLKKIQGVQL
jgi:hypothetical protein